MLLYLDRGAHSLYQTPVRLPALLMTQSTCLELMTCHSECKWHCAYRIQVKFRMVEMFSLAAGGIQRKGTGGQHDLPPYIPHPRTSTGHTLCPSLLPNPTVLPQATILFQSSGLLHMLFLFVEGLSRHSSLVRVGFHSYAHEFLRDSTRLT